MEATIQQIYADKHQADQAAQRLIAAGINKGAIQIIAASSADHHGTLGHMGSFGDNRAHTHSEERDHVGSFGDNRAHTHSEERDHVGSFAAGQARSHDALHSPTGSFASSQAGQVLLVVQLDATQAEAIGQLLRGQ